MSFSQLIQIIRDEGIKNYKETNFLAEVASTNPLKIKVQGIELDPDQLKISTHIDGSLNKKLIDSLLSGDELLLVQVNGYFVIVSKLEGVT